MSVMSDSESTQVKPSETLKMATLTYDLDLQTYMATLTLTFKPIRDIIKGAYVERFSCESAN